jgi:hypothetical protein
MRTIMTFEGFQFSNIKDITELENKLKDFSIPIDFWGKEYAKTTEHLFDEIQNNECVIREINGSIVRFIEFVGIRILYKDKNNEIWVLKEDRQEFRDGRVRRRDIPSSVSEKMKFGEDASLAAQRGIKEELGIDIELNQLIKQRPFIYNGSSQSYPGLKSKYKGNHFTCYFTNEQFNENGYIEVQKDKSTYFIWVKRD